MLNDEMKALLDSLSPVERAIDELFERALRANEQRFYVSIVDIERMYHDDKPYLVCQDTRHHVLQQFAEYFSDIINASKGITLDEHTNRFVNRLEMLAYSQFWECCGLQRLLHGLVGTIGGEEYKPRLWLDDNTSTFHIFGELVTKARQYDLEIGDVIDVLYRNEIRNSFAHSDFWIAEPFIMFFGSTFTRRGKLPSLHFDTWKLLFERTRNLITAIFQSRVKAEKKLKQVAPLAVKLPEFGGPFMISKDDRGYWTAKSQ